MDRFGKPDQTENSITRIRGKHINRSLKLLSKSGTGACRSYIMEVRYTLSSGLHGLANGIAGAPSRFPQFFVFYPFHPKALEGGRVLETKAHFFTEVLRAQDGWKDRTLATT